MIKLFSLLVVCVLVPRIGAADTLVTWTSEGEIDRSFFVGVENTGFIPPVGTTYQLTMSFNRAAMTPSFSSTPGDNCFTVPVTGQLTLSGVDYGLRGSGFTHGKLPGTVCSPGWPETQFLLGLSDVPGSPWPAFRNTFMELWYTDLVERDAFPEVPTSAGGGFQIRNESGSILLMARVNLRADLEQPTPVPEPGTMALVGLGLACAIRRGRAARRG